MFERQRHPFLLIGPPPAQYRYACSIRLWPIGLRHPCNDNHTPAKRIIVGLARRLRHTAAMAARGVTDRRADTIPAAAQPLTS